MIYLTAAVVLVGVLGTLNLLLSVGTIRRLREHTAHLNRLLAGGGLPPSAPPPGTTVGEFTARTVDGGTISRELLAERTLVGFFAPGCQACEPQLPGFVSLARSLGGPVQALAVVAGEHPDSAGTPDGTYLARLDGAARVVREAPDGPVQQAFQVRGFPTFCLVGRGGVVRASGLTVESLAAEGVHDGQPVAHGH